MREIKFRVWNEKKHVMIYDLDTCLTFGTLAEMNTDIVMQFTGLKDKNGKEIYEDDIVIKQTKNDGGGKPIENGRVLGTFVVRWSNDNCGFDINNTGGHGYEVIGNIYENPELLEVKK